MPTKKYLSAIQKEISKKPLQPADGGWKDVIEEMRAEDIETVPTGFQTVAEIARELGLSPERAGAILRRLKEKGRVEIIRCRRPVGSGVVRPVDHYRKK